MDPDTKALISASYLLAGTAAAMYVLLETGTGGRRYTRVAAKDPTGVLESDIGRGVVQVGKATLAALFWPALWLKSVGNTSRGAV